VGVASPFVAPCIALEDFSEPNGSLMSVSGSETFCSEDSVVYETFAVVCEPHMRGLEEGKARLLRMRLGLDGGVGSRPGD
jgi:hypothetical protein